MRLSLFGAQNGAVGQGSAIRTGGCKVSAPTASCLTTRFVLLCLFVFQGVASAQVKEIRRVLVLNDLGVVSSPGFAEIDQALLAGLHKSPYQIEFYQEILDLTSFPDDASQRRIREDLIRKYSDRKLELIIAAGSASLDFITQSHERFLRNTPIVFCTVLGEVPKPSKHDLDITGVLGRLHPEETLKAALRLLPGTEHVVVVGGQGKFDEKWEAIAKAAFQTYESKLDFTYLTDLTMPAQRLKHLPSNTIVYHAALMQDAAGDRFIDSAQAVPLVVNAANAPVFVMDDVDFREGTVGGDLVNWADDARVAADMAVRILNGEKPQDIPIVTSNHAYRFDWRALKRWGMKESNLPPGSTVLFREPSLWEQGKRILISRFLIIVSLSALTVYLLYSRTQLKLARDTQVRLSGLMIDAQERERGRLAAELHDDFSQRVALLVFGLRDAQETLSTSSNGVDQKLEKLKETVRELGDDLHAISHRLHSATLDKLGLVSGLRAMCRELSGGQRIQIAFLSEDVPVHISRDVALCIFRIVQEALQNLTKHSGAEKAEVRLRKSNEKLFLSVCDEGKGFDAKEMSNKLGLGIGSMQARARLLGGEFEIHSEPGKGTRIEVWVPLLLDADHVKC